MTKEGFIKLIKNAEAYNKELDKWYDFGIELYEKPIAELAWNFFNITLPELFTEEGIDWINWWLFDRISIVDGSINKVYETDGTEIPSETIDDLWNLVKDCQK